MPQLCIGLSCVLVYLPGSNDHGQSVITLLPCGQREYFVLFYPDDVPIIQLQSSNPPVLGINLPDIIPLGNTLSHYSTFSSVTLTIAVVVHSTRYLLRSSMKYEVIQSGFAGKLTNNGTTRTR